MARDHTIYKANYSSWFANFCPRKANLCSHFPNESSENTNFRSGMMVSSSKNPDKMHVGEDESSGNTNFRSHFPNYILMEGIFRTARTGCDRSENESSRKTSSSLSSYSIIGLNSNSSTMRGWVL